MEQYNEAAQVIYLSSVCRALVAVASWTDEHIPVPFEMHVASIPPDTLQSTPMAITHSRVSPDRSVYCTLCPILLPY
jgi:hypothetical protein